MKTINRLWRIGAAPLFRCSEFEGRSTRAEFWLFHLFVLSGVLLLLAIFTPLGLRFVHVEALRFTFETDGLSAGMKAFTFILFFGWALSMLLPLVAVTVRRIRDVGVTAHVLWPYFFIHSTEWWGIALECAYLVLFLWPGQAMENRYGPSLVPHSSATKAL